MKMEYWVMQMYPYDTHHLATGVVEIPAECPLCPQMGFCLQSTELQKLMGLNVQIFID